MGRSICEQIFCNLDSRLRENDMGLSSLVVSYGVILLNCFVILVKMGIQGVVDGFPPTRE
jgi:hypothetical protein